MIDDAELTELVRRSRAGDKPAFDDVSRRLRGWLESVALEITHDAEASRDIAQQALLNAYRSLGNYDAKHSFTTWMFAIVRNLSLNQARRKPHRPLGNVEPSAKAPDEVDRRETSAKLRRGIESLPGDARTVVVLRYIEGLDAKAIAARLGTSEGNVRVRLYRALQLLKGQLGELLS